MVDCCIFNVMYIVYCFICHQVDCCIIPRRTFSSSTFYYSDGYKDVDVVTQTVTTILLYGEEDRTTNQLTEEGRMSCDGCRIKVYFA